VRKREYLVSSGRGELVLNWESHENVGKLKSKSQLGRRELKRKKMVFF
jgi:hypothetical protein